MKYFLIVTTRTAQFDPLYIQPHYDYLEKLKQREQLGLYGPFQDGTGGAYVISAETLEDATRIVKSDPIICSGSSSYLIKEWKIQS